MRRFCSMVIPLQPRHRFALLPRVR